MFRTCVIASAVLLAAVTTLSAQQPKPLNDLEKQSLVGPVKCVHSVSMFQRAEDAAAKVTSTSDHCFNADGSLAEISVFDAAGDPIAKTVFRYNAQETVVDHSLYRGPQAGRTVTTKADANHRVREIDKYDVNGVLTGRTVYEASAEGTHVLQYDGSGQLVSDVARHVARTIAPDGTRETKATEDGAVVADTIAKTNAAQSEFTSVSKTPEGERRVTVVEDSGGRREVQIGPKGRTHAYSTDPSDQIMTSIDGGPDENEVRTVHRSDAAHRMTELDVYEGGALARRQIVTYEDDARGNWIKMVNRQVSADGSLQVIQTTTRTITYF